jgi:hypothetical protein
MPAIDYFTSIARSFLSTLTSADSHEVVGPSDGEQTATEKTQDEGIMRLEADVSANVEIEPSSPQRRIKIEHRSPQRIVTIERESARIKVEQNTEVVGLQQNRILRTRELNPPIKIDPTLLEEASQNEPDRPDIEKAESSAPKYFVETPLRAIVKDEPESPFNGSDRGTLEHLLETEFGPNVKDEPESAIERSERSTPKYPMEAPFGSILNDQDLDCFYEENKFFKSFTFNNWVPLSCMDVSLLESYESLYGQRSTIPQVKGGPFFFRNHPINYVVVCGVVVEAEARGDNRDVFVFTIDDGTGPQLTTVKWDAHGDVDKYLKKFVEIRGQLAERPKFGRELQIRDIFLKEVSLKDQFIAYGEAMLVRSQVLSKSWVIPDEEDKQDRFDRRAFIPTAPKAYCSLSRQNSILEAHPSFSAAIQEISGKDSLETLSADEQHIQMPPSEMACDVEDENIELSFSQGNITGRHRDNGDEPIEWSSSPEPVRGRRIKNDGGHPKEWSYEPKREFLKGNNDDEDATALSPASQRKRTASFADHAVLKRVNR